MLDFEKLCRSGTQKLLVFSGFEEEALTSIESFDVNSGVWQEVGKLKIARTKFSALALPDNRILVCGGKSFGGGSHDQVEEYDLQSEQSRILPIRLTEPKHGFGSCVLDGKLILCGGNNGEILNKVEFLDLLSMSWQRLPPLLESRDELALVVSPDKCIYALGGFGGARNNTLRSVERFDPHKNEWTSIAPMKEPRRSLAAVVLPDGIYVVGGYNGSAYSSKGQKKEPYLSSVEKFEFSTGRWSTVASMNEPRCSLAAVASQDC